MATEIVIEHDVNVGRELAMSGLLSPLAQLSTVIYALQWKCSVYVVAIGFTS